MIQHISYIKNKLPPNEQSFINTLLSKYNSLSNPEGWLQRTYQIALDFSVEKFQIPPRI